MKRSDLIRASCGCVFVVLHSWMGLRTSEIEGQFVAHGECPQDVAPHAKAILQEVNTAPDGSAHVVCVFAQDDVELVDPLSLALETKFG